MAGRGRLGPLGDDRQAPPPRRLPGGPAPSPWCVPGVVPASAGRCGRRSIARTRRSPAPRPPRRRRSWCSRTRSRTRSCALWSGQYVDEGVAVEMLGRDELGRLIDSHRAVAGGAGGTRRARSRRSRRRRGAGRRRRSIWLRRVSLAPTFVATGAYRRCCDVVARHGFAVLTGPPEMGKTAAARMLGLVRLCQGWEVHECSDPEQLWRVFRRDRRQMFIADDAFGSTEYRADAAERWARDLDRILKHMDDRPRARVDVAARAASRRPAPSASRERSAAVPQARRGDGRRDRPHRRGEGAHALSPRRRRRPWRRRAVGDPRARPQNIVGDPHLTPERIRRLVWERLANVRWRRRAGASGSRSRSRAPPTRWPRRSTLSTPTTATSWWRCSTRRRRRSPSAIWPPPSAATGPASRSRCRHSSTGSRTTSCAGCHRRR